MEHADNFLNWIKQSNGYISSKIAVNDYSESEGSRLGIVAIEDISKDEILFTIPRKCTLSRSTTKYRDAIKKHCKKIGWVPLMWSIILEKLSGDDSFWNPYFKILPEEIYLPSIWNKEDLKLLEGTDIEEMVPDSSEQFRKHFLAIKSIFPETANLEDKELERLFHYAGCLISAYSFCEDSDRELDIALVPLADTLNHRTGCNNARLYYEKDCLKMICHKDCPKGEQLFNTYGDLGNRELLVKYGFVDDPNPFHCVSFDPIEWLRESVQNNSKIGDGGSGSLRICDSDDLSFKLFDKFDGILPCQVSKDKNGNFTISGLKPFIDWVYLLSLPVSSGSKPSSWKVRSIYKDFLAVPENLEGLIEILRSRQLKISVKGNLPPGPELYIQVIKKQDFEIISGCISVLENYPNKSLQ